MRIPGDSFHKAWVVLVVLNSGAFRWDEVINIRLNDCELSGLQPHLVVTLESAANLKTQNAARVVPISKEEAQVIATLHEIRSARFPGDGLVPLFGDANDDRAIDGANHIHSLVTEALRAATGSHALSPHDLRGVFISRKAAILLSPRRDESLDTLALRQGVPELSAQAGHGHAGVTIENYLFDLDVLWRQWMDVILEKANCPRSLEFISGLTGISAATYRKRVSRRSSQTFDVMEGFDGGQLACTRIRTARDLVVDGVSRLEWDPEVEADGGVTRKAAYIGLRLLGESSKNAQLAAALPREAMELLEFGMGKLNGRRHVALSAAPHVQSEPFLQAFSETEPAPVFLDTNLGLNRVWEKELCDAKWIVGGWGCAGLGGRSA